jgi:hypothetical protein
MAGRKSKTSTGIAVSSAEIESSIIVVRGQRVLLDSTLAALYGVATQALNQAMKRNADRFPDDFAFQLTRREFDIVKAQTVASGWGGYRKLPRVFTEHGVAMLSSVLRSPSAARVNIEIMRAFVRLRRLLATPGEFAQQLASLVATVELHDDQIRAIAEVLKKMMSSPEPAEIGFHTIRRGGSDDREKT